MAPEEQARLDRTWPLVASRIVEEDVRVVWDAVHFIAGYELCPEVSARVFGYFVSGLHAYADTFDLEYAQEMLSQRKIPGEDFRWVWSGVTPRHYSACREYSILAGGVSGKRMKTPRARQPISPKQRWRILRRDTFTCQYCGLKAPAAHLEVDHIISVNDGGTNDDDNLKTACIDCNQGKGQESYR
jgi:HNH endonuclease